MASYLNVGCGRQLFSGFVNIDREPGADLQHDVTEGLPFDDGTVDGIYSEHFIEHITQGQGLRFMQECRRVLRPGGIVRLATPDLDDIVARYNTDQWLGSGFLRHGYDWLDNSAEMLNLSMRLWGHQWLYNEKELTRLGRMAGLDLIGRCELNRSNDPMLEGRETRPESLLIVEFRKPLSLSLEEASSRLVSILIPAFNPKYFRAALESALGQSYRNTEVVVGDDSPGDEIGAIVREYDDARLRYHKHPENIGGRANILWLVDAAQGEYIKFLNDDDLLAPECVERMVTAFATHPEVRLVTSYRYCIDEHGNQLHSVRMPRLLDENGLIEGRSLAQMVVGSLANVIGEPTTIMYRKADVVDIRPNFLSVGGAQLVDLGDVAVSFNMLMKGDCYYYVEPLSMFRLHPQQNQRKEDVHKRSLASWGKLREQALRLGMFDSEMARHEIRFRHDATEEWRTRAFNAGSAENSAEYRRWAEQHQLREVDGHLMAERMMVRWKSQPTIHLLIDLGDRDGSMLADTLDSLAPQFYKGWGLSIFATTPCPFEELGGGAIEWVMCDGDELLATMNRAVSETGAEWVGLIEPGDLLEPETLFTVVDYLDRHPRWELVYSDDDIQEPDGGRGRPRFKPDINPDLLRSMPYLGGLTLARREILEAVGGFEAAAPWTMHDIALKVLEQAGELGCGHIPRVLYHRAYQNAERADELLARVPGHAVVAGHLARMGIDSVVEDGYLPGSFRITYRHREQPLVSIIIPNKDAPDLLKPCVEGLLTKSSYRHFEILIVDNGSSDEEVLEFYAQLMEEGDGRVRIIDYPFPFNYSAMNNLAAREARGEYLLLLNNDTQVIQENWLERMLNHGQRPEVGIVGARLLFPDQTLQHAGVVLGMDQIAGHPFICQRIDYEGNFGRAQNDQNWSAVTAACMLIRKSLFYGVGGFDEESLKVAYNDVDLCLKVGEAGFKIVWTPYATLVHFAGTTQKRLPSPDAQARFRREQEVMLSRWLPRLAADPAFNRNLSLDRLDMTVEADLVPGWDQTFHDRARVYGFPLDIWGCGHYRVIEPLRALDSHAIAQVAFAPPHDSRPIPRFPSPAELERLAPDTVLLQSTLKDNQMEQLEKWRKFNCVFKVFDLDDLKTNLPDKNSRKRMLFPDMAERLERGLACCDRLVVSTEPLREAYRHLIHDIMVVPNRLRRERWVDLRSERRAGDRPRVGWAGAQQHHGDLEFIVELVKATADEVDWVFMGMCLDELRPLVREVHEMVPYDEYASKLASLNLDLAVAPLEQHPFNEAKSNLRILEYGVLGWPVVCTDIEPYRGAPVKRIGNSAREWIEAVRERIHDLDATAREGDRLREWVLQHWILEDHLVDWAQALSPSAVVGGEGEERNARSLAV